MSGKTYYGFTDLYHAKRRKQIIDKHPELRDLNKIDPSFKFVAALCAISQILVAYLVRDSPIWFVISMALSVGTLFNCAIVNALHETVHDLAIYGSPLANKVFGNFVNFSVGWPMIGGYYRTHRNHHSYLGTDLDIKYPTIVEAQQYDQTLWGRIKFVFLHSFNGGHRWEENVKEKPTDFAFWNMVTVYAFDVFVLIFFGYKAMIYLFLSFWINDCVFIQGSKNFVDHWVDNHTTYTSSYYGPINMINFNIGYHREHHDFPNIPGRYLAEIYKRATEFYADPTYIANNLFSGILTMLFAEPGKGLIKHANKLTVKEVALSGNEIDSLR